MNIISEILLFFRNNVPRSLYFQRPTLFRYTAHFPLQSHLSNLYFFENLIFNVFTFPEEFEEKVIQKSAYMLEAFWMALNQDVF